MPHEQCYYNQRVAPHTTRNQELHDFARYFYPHLTGPRRCQARGDVWDTGFLPECSISQHGVPQLDSTFRLCSPQHTQVRCRRAHTSSQPGSLRARHLECLESSPGARGSFSRAPLCGNVIRATCRLLRGVGSFGTSRSCKAYVFACAS